MIEAIKKRANTFDNVKDLGDYYKALPDDQKKHPQIKKFVTDLKEELKSLEAA